MCVFSLVVRRSECVGCVFSLVRLICVEKEVPTKVSALIYLLL